MKIRQIQSESISQLFSGKDISVLLYSKWKDIHDAGMCYFEVADNSGVLAYFSAYSYKKIGKPFLITPPGFPYCGFEILNLPQGFERQKQFYRNLSIAISEFLSSEFSRHAIDLSFPPEFDYQEPFLNARYSLHQRTTYLLDLSKSTEELLSGLSGNRKRNVKSVSKGYDMVASSLNPKVLDLVNFTVLKSGETKMLPIYEKLVSKAPLDFVNGITVSKAGEFIAGGIFIFDSTECYYFAGGFDPAIKDHNAGTICLWSAILKQRRMEIRCLISADLQSLL